MRNILIMFAILLATTISAQDYSLDFNKTKPGLGKQEGKIIINNDILTLSFEHPRLQKYMSKTIPLKLVTTTTYISWDGGIVVTLDPEYVIISEEVNGINRVMKYYWKR